MDKAHSSLSEEHRNRLRTICKDQLLKGSDSFILAIDDAVRVFKVRHQLEKTSPRGKLRLDILDKLQCTGKTFYKNLKSSVRHPHMQMFLAGPSILGHKPIESRIGGNIKGIPTLIGQLELFLSGVNALIKDTQVRNRKSGAPLSSRPILLLTVELQRLLMGYNRMRTSVLASCLEIALDASLGDSRPLDVYNYIRQLRKIERNRNQKDESIPQ